MHQDYATAFMAAQAEQRLIAKQAERAWIWDEAKRQGRVSARGSAVSRIGTALAGAIRLVGRRPTERPTPAPATRQRSAGAL